MIQLSTAVQTRAALIVKTNTSEDGETLLVKKCINLLLQDLVFGSRMYLS